MQKRVKKRVGIIGGGASGLICAIVASRLGCEVTIIEKNTKIGRKILASGNGRCNITNKKISAQNYHGQNPSFVSYAIKNFDRIRLENFFTDLGVEFTAIKDDRVFPMSLQASTIVDFLHDGCLEEGVKIYTHSEVKKVIKRDKFIVKKSDRDFKFDALVVASGSAAMPSLGATFIGYEIARSFSHTINPLFASLVQLKSDDPFCKKSSGVKIEAFLKLFVETKLEKEISGDLLFTDYGLSGLSILDISREASFALLKEKSVFIQIDLLPSISLSSLRNILKKKSKKFKNKPLSLWLNGMLHKKIVLSLIEKLKFNKERTLTTKEIHALSYAIKNLRIEIKDTKGIKSAEVMAGGVDCTQIDPKTMESKLHKGLYFIGEVLDVDADRGGYNLHWAFASGYIAGTSLGVV